MSRPRSFDDVLGRLPDATKRSRSSWTASCPVPGHDTPTGHLSLTDNGDKALVKCFGPHGHQEIAKALGFQSLTYDTGPRGGCAASLSVKPDNVITTPKIPNRTALSPAFSGGDNTDNTPGGLTLAALAEAKHLRVDFLKGLGLSGFSYQGRLAVRIPYYGTDGAEIAMRFRLALAGAERFKWRKGSKPAPYGLNRLPKSGRLLVVEGESDCWAAWYHGIPCLGIPGKSVWRDEWAEYLMGRDVTIWQEPDAQDFTARISKAVPGCSYIVAPDGIKDISDAHLAGLDVKPWLDSLPRHSVAELAAAAGRGLLDDVARFLRRYVVLTGAQADALALWVIHSYVFESAEATPYISITSPEKRSGKTRLLETLELVVKNPWLTGRVTPAVLARKVDAERPTLLLDESDAAFASDREYAEALRGILNTGHRRGGKTSLCVGQGAQLTYKDFSTFCPKAIAGIGQLPDTVADRAIAIIMKRRKPTETIKRFRHRHVESDAAPLRARLAAWAVTLDLADAEPDIPDGLDDRAADCWEPLLAIADVADGDWHRRSRDAALSLSGSQKVDSSLGIKLLSDIRDVFERQGVERIPSAELVSHLVALEESPWPELDRRSLSTHSLARMLKAYGIGPKQLRFDAGTSLKGYERAFFVDVWERYLSESVSLPVSGVLIETSETSSTNDAQTSKRNVSVGLERGVSLPSQARLTNNVSDVSLQRPVDGRAETPGQDIAAITKPLPGCVKGPGSCGLRTDISLPFSCAHAPDACGWFQAAPLEAADRMGR